MQKVTLSVITAIYNGESSVSHLISSLLSQNDNDFEWVVADGSSTDSTLEILKRSKSNFSSLIVDSRKDFGIYDALNRAIEISSGDYYIVLGADDLLYPNAIEVYKKECAISGAELVTCPYHIGKTVANVRPRCWPTIYSQFAYVSGHAVGLAIKKSLHKKVGYYSRSYPIAADQKFILEAINSGAKVHKFNEIIGRFGEGGISSADSLGALTESLRINIGLGMSAPIQFIIFIAKILKNRKKIFSKETA